MALVRRGSFWPILATPPHRSCSNGIPTYFWISEFNLTDSNLWTIDMPSRPTEGRIAIVTDAGRDAVDAGSVRRDT